MPICPQCASEFHTLAYDQCPSCGYSLNLCDQVYGDGYFDLTRVKDPAGALKQSDIVRLNHYLESLEKRIAPVALVVYLTDQGQSSCFSQHAHWALNHGKINHPSFGKRSQRRAAAPSPHAIRLRHQPAQSEALFISTEKTTRLSRLWSRVKSSFYRSLPPVEQRWVLMLVIDVQLQAACFSWGYMLDPYIKAQQLDKCIKDNRLKFRELSLYASIKHVMKRAVSYLASHAVDVNAQLRHDQVILAPAPELGTDPHLRQQATSKLVFDVDEAKRAHEALILEQERLAREQEKLLQAQELHRREEARLAEEAERRGVLREWKREYPLGSTSAAPAEPETSETSEASQPPEAQQSTRLHAALLPLALLSLGTLSTIGTLGIVDPPDTATPPTSSSPLLPLTPPTPWRGEDIEGLYHNQQAARYLQALPTSHLRSPNTSSSLASNVVLRDYQLVEHIRRSDLYLIDPHMLLTRHDRQQLEQRLQQIHAQSPYSVYVIIHARAQVVPERLLPTQLLSSAGKSGDYAVMIQYHLDQQIPLELDYSLIELSEEERVDILRRLRLAASQKATDCGAIMAVLDSLQEQLSAPSRLWDVDAERSRKVLPKLAIAWQSKPEFKRERRFSLSRYLGSGDIGALGWGIISLIGSIAGYLLLRRWYRYRCELYPTKADERLSSPVGAGVSRQIRYLEAHEIAPSRTPMMGPHHPEKNH